MELGKRGQLHTCSEVRADTVAARAKTVAVAARVKTIAMRANTVAATGGWVSGRGVGPTSAVGVGTIARADTVAVMRLTELQ